MFILQLLKLVLFIAFIYMLYNLIRFLFGLGRALRERREAEEKRARQNIREDGRRFHPGNGRGRKETIELDRDQYKVE
ncbi:MAG: hypothetical protein JXA07_14085 [Spirochaetes bacterium]|nr:hypothetical protein [Spirochaetota bacterium]